MTAAVDGVKIEPDLLDVRVDPICGCQISRKCMKCGSDQMRSDYKICVNEDVKVKNGEVEIIGTTHGWLIVVPCQKCLVLWIENELFHSRFSDRYFRTQYAKMTEAQKAELRERERLVLWTENELFHSRFSDRYFRTYPN
jgi:hypothetical protein